MRKLFFNIYLYLFLLVSVFTLVGCETAEEAVQKASSISYFVSEIEVKLGEGASSAVPSVSGASPFTFSISNVTSTDDNFLLDPSAISINSSSGVIALATNSDLPVGSYVLDISVSNIGGSSVFTNVFTFVIYDLPSGLFYDPSNVELAEGIEYTSNTPSINGSLPMQYSIINSSEVGSFVEIDPTTGVLHIISGQSIGGTYTVSVSASNSFGRTSFNDVFTIDITSDIPDVVGKWRFTSAVLVDGNATTQEADPLVIANLDLAGMPDEPIPIGDVARTSVLVGSSLAGFACDDAANYATSYLELRADNRLLFHCPAEDFIVDDELNIWVVVEDLDNPGSYGLTLRVVVAGVALPITIVDIVISADGSTFSGRALGYPMVTDITLPIAVDNIQFISADMVFTKIE